jgi:chemotaxis-related protein WspD
VTVVPGQSTLAEPVVDSCWNRIGTRGDRSCPELAVHIRCRNCPVFAGAATVLLDRPLPAGYAAAWNSHLTDAKAPEPGKTRSAVILRLNAEWFALPTDLIDEVTETRQVHSLPHRRNPMVLGLCNVRGEVIVCISLHAMLGLPDIPRDTVDAAAAVLRPRLVVIRHASGPAAFRVDEVQPTFRVDEAALRIVPTTIAKAGSNYVRGLFAWNEQAVGYLDADRIVHAINQSLA